MSIEKSNTDINILKSSAQVDPLVRPHVVSPQAGGLMPKRNKPHRLMGRFSDNEREIVLGKAKAEEMSVNEYIRASALGSAYRPPINPELHKTLLSLNRELTAHGRNLNQIAKQLNTDTATPNQGIDMLDAIRVPLVRALYAVKNALVQGAPQP